QEAIAPQFQQLLIDKFAALKIGDPMLPETNIGPLATPDILQELDQQVQTTVKLGGKILIGGKSLTDRPGNYYLPTIITDIPLESPGFTEEFFGPVALFFTVKDLDHAIKLANSTDLGLGASAWTNIDAEKERLIAEIEAGAVFINGLTKSDPRLPFGGIKRSGYGRELGIYGMQEFLNIKTIWMN
ncbi:MAG TPA: aldehyde dehydrogenase family protein, partial [Allocoleopsis sp.]